MADASSSRPTTDRGRASLAFVVATTIFGSGYAFIGERLFAGIPLSVAQHVLVVGTAFGFVLLHLFTFARRFGGHESSADEMLAWVSYVLMGLFAVSFSLVVVRDLLWLLVLGLETVGVVGEVSGAFLLKSDRFLWAGIPVVSLFAVVEARRVPRVKQVEVTLDNLPEAFDGYRIAQLSDIHIGQTIKGEWLAAVVDEVNAADVDAVAITGDVVDGSVEELLPDVSPLGQLQAKDGVYLVTGNHEYYAGAEQWVDAFGSQLGLDVLLNQHRVVTRGDAQLVIGGVTDFSAGSIVPHHRSDPHATFAGAPPDAPKILLAHQPRSAPEAARAGVDLQLSGHTHGGQLFPWNFFVPLQQPGVRGLELIDGVQVYIHQGTGYWGPPMRLLAPSEIAILTLRKGRSAPTPSTSE